MSKLRETLDRTFRENKGKPDAEIIKAAQARTHQKPSTLKIYLWRFKKTGSTGKGVVKKKESRATWKSEIWNKGKKTKGHAKKAAKKTAKPRKRSVPAQSTSQAPAPEVAQPAQPS